MSIHHHHMTGRALALLLSGAPIHTKDGDPLEVLRKSFGDHNAEVLRRLGVSDTEMKQLSARLSEIEQKAARGYNPNFPTAPETWGTQVMRTEDVRSINSNWRGRLRLDVKATITSSIAEAAGSAGGLMTPDRPGVIELPRRKLRVRSLFSPGTTSSGTVEWPRMTARNLNAATQAEGATKGQSDLTFNLQQWPVRTIAHWMLASKQILDDAPALASIIDTELRFGVDDVEDNQLLNGGGTGTDLTGVYTGATAFSPPFVVDGNATMIDVLLQAIAQVDDGDFDTDGIVLNPLDWRKIQSIKDSEGRYVGGGPFGDLVQRLWQLPIVTTKAMTQDHFMVGACRQGAQIFDRQEATVDISTEDSDNFRKNLVTLRGEKRLAFVVKHPDAFVKGNFTDALAAS